MSASLESDVQESQSGVSVIGNEAQTDRLQMIVRELMTELGMNLTDQHFRGTPARVARLYRELTRGAGLDAAAILKTFHSKHRELIVVSDINFYSLCPHHLLT